MSKAEEEAEDDGLFTLALTASIPRSAPRTPGKFQLIIPGEAPGTAVCRAVAGEEFRLWQLASLVEHEQFAVISEPEVQLGDVIAWLWK